MDNTFQSQVQNIPETPVPQNNPPQSHFLRWIVWLTVGLVLLIAIGIGAFYIVRGLSSSSNSQNQTNGVPSVKTVDLAPSVAANLKTVLLIRNSDSSLEKVIIPTQQVDVYIKTLPEGEQFISKSPDP